jgi:hypothetical protein
VHPPVAIHLHEVGVAIEADDPEGLRDALGDPRRAGNGDGTVAADDDGGTRRRRRR